MRKFIKCLTFCSALAIAMSVAAQDQQGTTAPVPPAHPNVLPVVVDLFPAGGNHANLPTVSVTLCVPDHPDQCQTIDHILVDTGATGLRILRDALKPELQNSFPAETVTTVNDSQSVTYRVAECLRYIRSSAWGSVTKADVWLGSKPGDVLAPGQTALHRVMPIHLIGAKDVPEAAAEDCRDQSVDNTIAEFGSNGTIGVSPALMDNEVHYYLCTAEGICQRDGTKHNAANKAVVEIDHAHRVPNPVYMMPADNNGIIFQLDAIADHFATSASGQLILGINTEPNNQLDTSLQILRSSTRGNLTSVTAQKKPIQDAATSTSYQAAIFTNYVALDTGASTVSLGPVPGYNDWSKFDMGDLNLTFKAEFLKSSVTSKTYAQPFLNTLKYKDKAARDAAVTMVTWHNEGLVGLSFFYGKTVYLAFEDPMIASVDVSSDSLGWESLNLFPNEKPRYLRTKTIRDGNGKLIAPFYAISP